MLAINYRYRQSFNYFVSKSSFSEVFLRKDVLKICSRFTEEHPCRSAISINLLCNFVKITLRYGCSPVNLLHIFRTPFYKNTSEELLLCFSESFFSPFLFSVFIEDEIGTLGLESMICEKTL